MEVLPYMIGVDGFLRFDEYGTELETRRDCPEIDEKDVVVRSYGAGFTVSFPHTIQEISVTTLLALNKVTRVEAIKMDCEGCEYLLDYDLFESTKFLGEVHLPDRARISRVYCEGCDSSERFDLLKEGSFMSIKTDEVWKRLCEHGRFAIHGCETLRDWLVAKSATDRPSR